MSETPWTEGPWLLMNGRDGGWSIAGTNEAVICARNPWSHRAAENEANARLIKESPAMADLLLDLVKTEDGPLTKRAREILARIGAA